jgi:hypothetical protein
MTLRVMSDFNALERKTIILIGNNAYIVEKLVIIEDNTLTKGMMNKEQIQP